MAPDLLQGLPTSALAAVVIASPIGLIEITNLREFCPIQRWEFWLSIIQCDDSHQIFLHTTSLPRAMTSTS